MPPKRKVATSSSAPSHTLLKFFRPASVHSENAQAAASLSRSKSIGRSGSVTKSKAPVLGTSPENAVIVDDSDSEEDDLYAVPTPKKARTSAPDDGPPALKPETSPVASVKLERSTPSPLATATLVQVEEQPWEAGDDEYAAEEEAIEGNLEPSLLVDEEDLMDTFDDPEVTGGSDDIPAFELATCPVCSMLFDDEDDPIQHVNSCLDKTADRSADSPGAGSSKPASTSALSTKKTSSLHSIFQSKPSPASKDKASSTSSSFSIFSVLMSSHKENAAWKEAERDEARAGTKLNAERLAQQKQKAAETGTGGNARRLAPFYKVMQGMPVAVDAFRYGKIPGVNAYLLTHFHSDHYTSLASNWKHGPIYCSATTASLVKLCLGVNAKWVHPLPLDKPTLIPDTEVTVTLIEANHCPGSVLFFLEGRQTVSAGDSTYKSPHIGSARIFRYLHCGDFRAAPQHVLHPAVKGKKIDIIYLDTTYLNPKYCFPPQRQVIDACAALAKQQVLGAKAAVKTELGDDGVPLSPDAAPVKSEGLSGWLQPSVKLEKSDDVVPDVKPPERILVAVGTYTIGKERIVKAIAQALSSKIYVDARKLSILKCEEDPELHAMLTRDPLEASVHIVRLGDVNSDKIGDYLAQFKGAFTRIIGFRPTGWTYAPPAGTDTSMPAVAPLIQRQQARTFLAASLTPMRNSTPKHMLYGVPYSEHSSFTELTCFSLSLDWARIIATVNVGSEAGRGRMSKWFEKWQAERKRRIDRREPSVVPFRSTEYW